DLRAGMRVLDVPCGHGRIANRLARRGCRVVGVDRSASFLDVARRDGDAVEYVQAGMRELTPEGPFDAVINWFTSFGYFDDARDRARLAGGRRALVPGGKLVMALQTRQRVLAAVAAMGGRVTVLRERGDDLLVDRTTFDVNTARTETERISVRNGNVRRYW